MENETEAHQQETGAAAVSNHWVGTSSSGSSGAATAAPGAAAASPGGCGRPSWSQQHPQIQKPMPKASKIPYKPPPQCDHPADRRQPYGNQHGRGF
eukprot:8704466-Pyramimonas_sp.AAC.1